MPKIRPIVRAIRENEIDLVHVNSGLRHGKPGIIAAWLTKTPCVCHVRMFHKLNLFDKVFTPFIDAFVYISNAIAKDYIAQGVPPLKGTVVHNGVDLGEFTPIHDAAQVRSEFGWTTHERLVGVIGRLDCWKGHEYFLEAVAEIAQEILSLRGLIVGEPENTPLNREYYQKLQSLTKSLCLEDKVIFTGFRGDVPRLMSALDVVVLSSSLPEPFGRVVIEGMAAGKPVVATAAGGVLDIIEDGVNGLLVPCKDAKAMAQAIFWLLSNQEQAEQIGRAARQRVAEKFTVPHYVAAVQSVYDTLMGKVQSCMAPLEIIEK
jgi:glycosyltransferase involved in cell wall biosynthesis